MKNLVALSLLVAFSGSVAYAADAAAPAAPAGWKLRIDRSTSATDPDGAGQIKFTKEGAGFHAVNPQAATYWAATNNATGQYTLKARFTQLEVSNHENFFGLFIGGSELEGPAQKYTYFMISQEGNVLVKRRDGTQTSDVVSRKMNPVVKKPDATGKSVNDLELRVQADKVDFAVNGTVVASVPKTGAAAGTDGIYGIRVNHFLNVQIDNLTLTPGR